VAKAIEEVPRAAYSVPEVCASLGCSKDWLRRQIGAGRIRAVKLGARVFVPRDELERFARGEIGDAPITDDRLKRQSS